MTGGEGFILDSNFSDNLNQEFNGGGALFIENSSPFVSGCSFTGNKTYANNYGGAVQFVSQTQLSRIVSFGTIRVSRIRVVLSIWMKILI